MEKNHLLISVMGTMGSGKTTAAKLLAKKLSAHLLMEQFEDNPFLSRFYEDMPRWAFHSQTFFLLEKIRQLEEIPVLLEKTSVIQDTPIHQDVFSYAKAQRELGNMDADEWHLYCKLYESLDGHLKRPDLIVYLDASIETVMSRIANRGREYEEAIPEEYVRILTHLNQEWLKKNKTIPVCHIDTNVLNIVEKEQDKTVFFSYVHDAVQEFLSIDYQ